MANKQSSLLMTLGKRMLGFSASSSGCCAGPGGSRREGSGRDGHRHEPKGLARGGRKRARHKLLLDCSRERAHRESFCMSDAAPGRSGASDRHRPRRCSCDIRKALLCRLRA